MGWGSSADPYSNTTSWLNFKTKEQAIQFAQRQGWEVCYSFTLIHYASILNKKIVTGR